MLSLKNSTPNNLQAIPEQTTRIFIKNREEEIIIEVDTTREEIVIKEKAAEDMGITMEEIIVAYKTIEEIILDKIQVVIIVITTTTITTTTKVSDKMNKMMKQQ